MAGDGDDLAGTTLVVITTETTTSIQIAAWLRRQMPAERVAVRAGFYAGMTAIARDFSVVVVDVGVLDDRAAWRLAEVRTRAPGATVVVVADAVLLPRLVGPLRPDLAVRSTVELPPLRELLVTGTTSIEPSTIDQTIRRRSAR